MRRPLALASLVSSVLLVGACEPPVGEVVTCVRTWSCNGNEVSSDSQAFCTDPGDQFRQDQIDAYQSGFAENCDNVQLSCGGDVFADCAAVCTIGAECAIEDADNIRL